MPYKIRKLRNKELYQVKNSKTGEIHSKHANLNDAKKQVRLLYKIEKQKEIDQIKLPVNPFEDLVGIYASSKHWGSARQQPIPLGVGKGNEVAELQNSF